MSSHTSQQKILKLCSSELVQFLLAMKQQGLERQIPNISWNTALFLIEKLRNRNISNILEIGPANGFSTMMLALACPKAEITSIECSRHAFEELRHNIHVFNSLQDKREESREQRGGFSFLIPANFPPRVTSAINQEIIGNFHLYYADARELLPAFQHGASEIICRNPESILQNISAKKFDFIFIDGAFRMTREFYDLSRPLLDSNGITILDDAIKYRWKMEGFHEYLEENGTSFELVQTDPDDGVMVIENLF